MNRNFQKQNPKNIRVELYHDWKCTFVYKKKKIYIKYELNVRKKNRILIIVHY